MVFQSVRVLRCRTLGFVLVVLLTKVLTLCECVQGCRPGWFGNNCEFHCNCQSGTCDNDGDCLKCSHGFFGQKCQYVNEALYHATPTTIYTDGQENTCNSDTHETVFETSFRPEISLTWFRIIANNNANLLNFTIKWNGNISCFIDRKFIVDNQTVDGTCEVAINVQTVRIEGSVVGSLCEFLFSGGVLLSGSGTTNQTSDACLLCGSDKAVDEVNSPDDPSHRCAITDGETNSPEWCLTFFQPHTIHAVVLYVQEETPSLHVGLVVKTITSNGTEIILDKIYDMFRAVRFQTKPQWYSTAVVKLSVMETRNNLGSQKQLTICETVPVGDIVCSKNTYGPFCTECNCRKTEVCHPYTGGCSLACPVGYYGDTCTLMCSANCRNNVCTFDNGTCLRCKPGYEGNMCTEECYERKYGQDCIGTCSQFCIGKCDHVTGDCSSCTKHRLAPRCIECPAGFYGKNCSYNCSDLCDKVCHVNSGECFRCIGHYIGPFCEDCADGYHGEMCDLKCSKLCLKKRCDRLSGDCLECIGNRIGTNCEGCEDHFFGLQCDKPCSTVCINETCDHFTGKCDACEKGYKGELCSSVTGKPAHYTAAVSLFPFVLLIFFLIPDCGNDSDDEDDEDDEAWGASSSAT